MAVRSRLEDDEDMDGLVSNTGVGFKENTGEKKLFMVIYKYFCFIV